MNKADKQKPDRRTEQAEALRRNLSRRKAQTDARAKKEKSNGQN